jgi:hypothetical protein
LQAGTVKILSRVGRRLVGAAQTNLERSTMAKREMDIGNRSDAPLIGGLDHHCAVRARRIFPLVRGVRFARARHV